MSIGWSCLSLRRVQSCITNQIGENKHHTFMATEDFYTNVPGKRREDKRGKKRADDKNEEVCLLKTERSDGG